ncbi:MAG: hypothetical protein M3Y72_24445 [Acidobacteriota bacterium]|nr:hypothetical protein [Acidobacteriota bacterium]
MKVLLDEDLDHRLRTSLIPLSQHEVVTVRYMGWAGLQNGELLKTAEENGIEVFITRDKNLSYQQNLSERRMAIVALSATNWPIIKNHVPQISAAIDNAAPCSYHAVECGRFSRKRQKEIQIEPEQSQPETERDHENEQERDRER